MRTEDVLAALGAALCGVQPPPRRSAAEPATRPLLRCEMRQEQEDCRVTPGDLHQGRSANLPAAVADYAAAVDELESAVAALGAEVDKTLARAAVALPNINLDHLEDVPAPDVLDAKRLAKAPWRKVEVALAKYQRDGDRDLAEALEPQARRLAERAIFPVRAGAVEVLEDLYRVRPRN